MLWRKIRFLLAILSSEKVSETIKYCTFCTPPNTHKMVINIWKRHDSQLYRNLKQKNHLICHLKQNENHLVNLKCILVIVKQRNEKENTLYEHWNKISMQYNCQKMVRSFIFSLDNLIIYLSVFMASLNNVLYVKCL